MISNTGDPFQGTGVIFAGGTAIGPGDLNGNLDAGPNSDFIFAAPGSGTPPANSLLAGATFGPGTGTIVVAASVTVNGSLDDNTETLQVAGGNLTGAGKLNENAILNWTGGAISLGGSGFGGAATTLMVPGGVTDLVADSVEDHFDTVPDGMEESDTPTSVTVTQVQPPA